MNDDHKKLSLGDRFKGKSTSGLSIPGHQHQPGPEQPESPLISQLTGNLKDKPIGLLLQIADHYEATGQLQIGGIQYTVTIQFGLGKPIHAFSPFNTGTEAILELFTWQDGKVTFQEGVQPATPSVEDNAPQILTLGDEYVRNMQFLQRLEITELSFLLRSALKLNEQELEKRLLTGAPLNISMQKEFYGNIYGTLNVKDICHKMNLSESRWMATVVNLLRLGLILTPDGKSLDDKGMGSTPKPANAAPSPSPKAPPPVTPDPATRTPKQEIRGIISAVVNGPVKEPAPVAAPAPSAAAPSGTWSTTPSPEHSGSTPLMPPSSIFGGPPTDPSVKKIAVPPTLPIQDPIFPKFEDLAPPMPLPQLPEPGSDSTHTPPFPAQAQDPWSSPQPVTSLPPSPSATWGAAPAPTAAPTPAQPDRNSPASTSYPQQAQPPEAWSAPAPAPATPQPASGWGSAAPQPASPPDGWASSPTLAQPPSTPTAPVSSWGSATPAPQPPQPTSPPDGWASPAPPLQPPATPTPAAGSWGSTAPHPPAPQPTSPPDGWGAPAPRQTPEITPLSSQAGVAPPIPINPRPAAPPPPPPSARSSDQWPSLKPPTRESVAPPMPTPKAQSDAWATTTQEQGSFRVKDLAPPLPGKPEDPWTSTPQQPSSINVVSEKKVSEPALASITKEQKSSDPWALATDNQQIKSFNVGVPLDLIEFVGAGRDHYINLMTRPETGILTQDALEFLLEREFSRAFRFGSSFTFMPFCITVEATGWPVLPMEIIALFTRTINQLRRDVDLLGHFGDRGLAFVLPNVESAQASALAERIVETLPEELPQFSEYAPALHFGIASVPKDATDLAKVVAAAQEAMFEAASRKVTFLRFSDLDDR